MTQKAPKRSSIFVFNEFTILFVFAAVSLTMLFFGGLFGVSSLDWDGSAKNSSVPAAVMPPAPTTEAYQAETRGVMTPFLQAAANMKKENFAVAADPAMLDLVNKTQERMLTVRVPKDSRDGHLAFVLLLDQWKRALGGSKIDQDAVLKKTPQLTDEYPWVMQQ